MSDMNSFLDGLNSFEKRRAQAQAEGLVALHRLAEVASDDTGQSETIGRFLLGLYNGHAYPFNLVSLRGLDIDLHDDCMAVLRMDYEPEQEIHEYLANGPELLKQLRERMAGGEGAV